MTWSRLGFSDSSNADVNDVRNAISRAAQKTGVDFGYLLSQAKSESGLNPRAQAQNSSAGGLFPPLENARGGRTRKADRKAMMAERAGEALQNWLAA